MACTLGSQRFLVKPLNQKNKTLDYLAMLPFLTMSKLLHHDQHPEWHNYP